MLLSFDVSAITKVNPKAKKYLQDLAGGDYNLSVGPVKNSSERKTYGRLGRTKNITLLEVATFHENGIGVPKRSFIKKTFFENRKRINRDINRLFKKSSSSMEARHIQSGLRKLGGHLSAHMKRKFYGHGRWRRLSRTTRPYDNPRYPLNATEQLAKSIGYVVLKKGKPV